MIDQPSDSLTSNGRPEVFEVCFDGLVGPTHNYGGLAAGNVAAERHAGQDANPKAAALEGLAKLRLLLSRGALRAVLPPQERPDIGALRRLGFEGADSVVLGRAAREPGLLAMVSSASSMWAANAATVIPSADAQDGRLHLVVANLASASHRALESRTTHRVLRKIFADARFAVHAPLPRLPHFTDEGAANHLLLSTSEARAHVFGYGRRAFSSTPETPTRSIPRQTLEASAAVARLGHLAEGRGLFWRQSAEGLDAGAFHSDVLAVGGDNLLLLHEAAFDDPAARLRELEARLGRELSVVLATTAELPLADAVQSYAFNSELVTSADGHKLLIAPEESRQNKLAQRFLERALAESSELREILWVDVLGSMKNGGGPACLRLRVQLTGAELAALSGRTRVDATKLTELEQWVERHYRDRLAPSDLADPGLLDECRRALDELTALLDLGSLYDFQAAP